MRYLQILTRYNAWANELFLSAVSSLPGKELTAPRPIVFGSLLRTLNHVYAMDYVWQCHLLGKPHGLESRNPEECPTIHELIEKQRKMDKWYIGYSDSITEIQSTESIDFTFIGGGTGRMTRQDIIFHVVNHTSYHRGHAADILYNIGISPPTTDFPVFLREQSSGI